MTNNTSWCDYVTTTFTEDKIIFRLFGYKLVYDRRSEDYQLLNPSTNVVAKGKRLTVRQVDELMQYVNKLNAVKDVEKLRAQGVRVFQNNEFRAEFDPMQLAVRYVRFSDGKTGEVYAMDDVTLGMALSSVGLSFADEL